jgi:hypothetical protein
LGGITLDSIDPPVRASGCLRAPLPDARAEVGLVLRCLPLRVCECDVSWIVRQPAGPRSRVRRFPSLVLLPRIKKALCLFNKFSHFWQKKPLSLLTLVSRFPPLPLCGAYPIVGYCVVHFSIKLLSPPPQTDLSKKNTPPPAARTHPAPISSVGSLLCSAGCITAAGGAHLAYSS